MKLSEKLSVIQTSINVKKHRETILVNTITEQ